MREKLIQYVNLLFAGSRNTEDIRLEILQNTLDRYDDLLIQGKTPEAAYQLAISGIGNLSEILSVSAAEQPAPESPLSEPEEKSVTYNSNALRRTMQAAAIGLYILSLVPLIIFDELGMEIIGVSCMLLIVAIATVLLLLFPNPGKKQKLTIAEKKARSRSTYVSKDARSETSINKLIGIIGLGFYLVLSFATGAWFITWLIFPIMGAVKGLVNACIDLKEAE